MKDIKTIKKLTIIKSVTGHRWRTVMDIVEIFPNVVVLEKSWSDSFKQNYSEMYPLDLSDINTWSTYDNSNCIDLEFTIKDDVLYCDVKISDRASFDRYSTPKFIAKLILPIEFCDKIENIIESDYNYYLANEYEKYLAKKRLEWMNDLSNEILK